ncbi:peptide-N-glycosidase F-related protein [Sorangium atrum]|uniref:Peptide-N-glycosidase F-related protein n=1 Tax=Sorangium atrum TaxID=2995308 RepID=A0ABT5BRV6_9BACT|nr:peptide-N-glycosidase F-related protein [Sorangium aterium]MDC0676259.1 peptide-N-glycosidase F-related protein [Sorangium aterium]
MTFGRTLRRAIPCLCPLALLAACTEEQPSDAGAGGGTGTSESTGSTSTATGTSAGTGGAGESDGSGGSGGSGGVPSRDPEEVPVLENVVFYDGYAETVDEPIPDGVIRHNNSLVATRLTDELLAKVQTTLKVRVVVGALCDNYDRLGSVNLALVPKGAQTYVPGEVDRIEVARFVTPFMDMNKQPTTVPYEWEASNLVPILKDPDLLADHDIWFELGIFGVPYAANDEVPGCAGRNDTQLGSLMLYTDSTKEAQDFSVLLPLAISEDFNNYATGASDKVGTTRKTVRFELPADTQNAQLVLITSNHGANEGGEEYIRREHYVYVDGELALQYKPGRTSCEPFRKYNTQGNGIYGRSPRSDAQWQSFSNWCPGDAIDTRIVPWGAASAGMHEFVIDVPDATFVGGEGNFPFSLYVQAQ